MSDTTVGLISNIITAAAYYVLTYELFTLVRSSELVKFVGVLQKSNDSKKRGLFFMVIAMAVLFASFIALCGNTHALSAVRYFSPDSPAAKFAQVFMLVLCAFVSIATALVAIRIIPKILEVLTKFELNSEGNLQHVENYLIEVVEMVNESILVLKDDLTISRCNEASKSLFHCSELSGNRITEFIHPEDVRKFEEAMQHVLGGYNNAPLKIEYRVARSDSFEAAAALPTMPTVNRVRPGHSLKNNRATSRPSGGKGNAKIFADYQKSPPKTASGKGGEENVYELFGTVSEPAPQKVEKHEPALLEASGGDADYLWVESTVCKGMIINQVGDFEYDLKMITRNIEDRKRQAREARKTNLQASEEQARFNSARMHFISSVANDLQAPLDSFCQTLTSLKRAATTTTTATQPAAQQGNHHRDSLRQAEAAVDLMRLTISQAIDITKALNGDKLMPRYLTVSIPDIVQRVKATIDGYSKKVPIFFEVSEDVCSTIISHEEWLWQMLLGLLKNACKNTTKGNILVKISRCHELALPNKNPGSVRGTSSPSIANIALSPRVFGGDVLLFQVSDTGVGIDSDKMKHLFDAFAKVGSDAKERDLTSTGLGLGLFGVRTRVEGLNGSCGAYPNTSSSTGTGMVVWFSIPYEPDHLAGTPTETATGTTAVPFTSGSAVDMEEFH